MSAVLSKGQKPRGHSDSSTSQKKPLSFKPVLAPGPDDFNGYGYFYVRLYWTGFGFQASLAAARFQQVLE